jgi:hypothetical protein
MSLLWTPEGTVNTERPEIHWPLEFMRFLAIFAANAQDVHLGIRCERCKEVLRGENAREDNFWRMECACRKYLGRNPLSTATKKASAH